MFTMMEKYGRLLDGTGGTGGDGTGGNTGGQGGGNGGGNGGGQGGGAAWAAPAGFPQEFLGATAEESYNKLLSGYSELNGRAEGLRTKLATLPKAPDSHDKYTFEPGEKLKPYFGDVSNSPAFDFMRQAAHKHGLSQEQFAGVLSDVYGPMAEKGLLGTPFNPQAEVSTFMTQTGLDRAQAAEVLTNNETFAKGLSAQLRDIPEKMKPDVEAALLTLTDTAAGNVLLRALSSRMAENGIRIAGESTIGGEMTVADLKKLDADPRIDPANRNHPDAAKRFDADLRARYDAAYKRHYP